MYSHRRWPRWFTDRAGQALQGPCPLVDWRRVQDAPILNGFGANLDLSLEPLTKLVGRDIEVVVRLQPEPELR